jgi:hypothetical protein
MLDERTIISPKVSKRTKAKRIWKLLLLNSKIIASTKK